MSNTTTSANATATQVGSPCVACRLPLPIQPAPVNERGEYWLCAQCDTRHHGVLLSDAPPELAANVRPGEKKQATKQFQKKPLPERGPVVCDHKTMSSRLLDHSIDNGSSLSVSRQGPPFQKNIQRHGAEAYSRETESEFAQQYDQSSQHVEDLVGALERGSSLDLNKTELLTRDSLSQAARDLDLFVKMGINLPDKDYAGKHNYHVAMLAASLGANMGWDKQTLTELGVGCLLHDIGMSRLPEKFRNSSRLFDAGEFAEIAQHPLHTFDIIENEFQQVSLLSRMVAYQIHERCDGSGYPRNRKGNAIHEAARVAAVADVYIALVSPRPHRPALVPHYAAKHILYGVREGKFDGVAVRALLRTISLYPIGSFLELKDGRVCRVIRAHSDLYSKPVVEAWRPGRLQGPPEVIDLAAVSAAEILRPIASLGSK